MVSRLDFHVGLEGKEIRDFLSLAFVKNYKEDMVNCKSLSDSMPPYSQKKGCPFDWAILELENRLKHLNKELELKKSKQALIRIMEMNGWTDFDMSDVVPKDIDYDGWFNFIGTESEREKFLVSIGVETQ